MPSLVRADRGGAERGGSDADTDKLVRFVGDDVPATLGRDTIVTGGVDFPLLEAFCGLSDRGEGTPLRTGGTRILPLLAVRECPRVDRLSAGAAFSTRG